VAAVVRTDELPLGLLGFIAFVALAPIWTRYLGQFAAARPEDQFLAALVLPAAAILFVTSWVKPELSGLALGGFMIVSVVLMAPWLFKFIDMLSGQMVDSPLAQTVLELAVPLLVVSFLISLGRRRLRGQA
jgi:hypothetical protein